MSVEQFTGGQEPDNPEAVIWRFMELWKFQDLITSGTLYFFRADLFEKLEGGDQNEGLPPDGYFPSPGMDPLDIHDALQLNHHIGSLAQDREGFYVNCWYLATEPTAEMWQQYSNDGVAIASRYSLLKGALARGKDRGLLGLVRYGSEHMTGWNVLRFISTKRKEFAHEKEVRALLWFPNDIDSDSRHFDEKGFPHRRPLTGPPVRIPDHKRLPVQISSLVTEIQVSPWPSDTTFAEVKRLLREKELSIPVRWSDLTKHKDLIGTQKNLLQLLRGRAPK